MQIKRYRFNRAINFRDMGGVYAENDKIVRWNKLYRSDKFEGTTDDEWATMHKSGIKTILDMRSFKEADISPDKCPDDFKYIHCPLVEEDLSFDNIDSPAMQAFAKSVGEGYKNIVLTHGDNLAKIINIISSNINEGGVVFHCTSGKDRTGVVASAIYYILGVSIEDIVADYQVSYTYNKIMSDKFMFEHPEFRQYRNVVLSKAENIYELLMLYKELDIENYLLKKGADTITLDLFKKNVLM